MKRLSLGLFAALTSVAVSAQTPQAPTFRSTTALVLVDVTVLDHDGKPVSGLAADDFEVKLDGQVRPVKAVTYEEVSKATPVVATPDKAPRRDTTNAMAGNGPRVFVMLVDDLSIAPSRGKSLFRSAARFVASLPPTDAIGFTTTSHSVNVNPTFDHAAISAALDRATGELIDPAQMPGPVMGRTEALEIYNSNTAVLNYVVARDCFNGRTPSQKDLFQNDCAEQVAQNGRAIGGLVQNLTGRQLQSYLDVIQAMRAAPGLKQLVVISDGLALATHPDNSILLEPLAKAAASAGVQVSMLSAEPDGIDLGARSGQTGSDRLADERSLRSNIQTIAEMTGGQYYQVIGLGDPTFARVGVATSALYQLGVAAEDAGGAGKDYALAVRVTKPGYTVRANRHAIGPVDVAPVPASVQLQQAVGNGVALYGVPLSVGTALSRGGAADQVTVNVNLAVPGSVRGPVAVVFALGSQNGAVHSGSAKIDKVGPSGEYRTTLAVPVAAGDYRLRVAVADADGKVGSLQTTIGAQLARFGPVLASDLMTGYAAADRQPQFLALERVPPAATVLLASLELYPAAGPSLPAGTTVHLTLVGNEEAVVAEGDAMLSRVGDSVHADGALGLGRFAPGVYTLRAAVVVDGKAVGTVSTSVRLSGSGSGS